MKHIAYAKQKEQTGSGLIEVLVLIMIMSIGMLAMGKIHTVLMRDGGTANNRAIAASLAQQKLDDLRSFKWRDPASSNGENCNEGIFCYSEIGNNTGGIENSAGDLLLPPNVDVTIGNTAFRRSWISTDNTTYKVVAVTITWTDQNGPASLSVRSAFFGDDSTITAFGADDGAGITLPGPKVAYTPIGVPDVVPMDLGNGLKRETSRPLPDVSSKGYSVRTHFESVTYTSTNKKSTQDEFVTVSCTCEFSTAGEAFPASYFIYKDGQLDVKYPSGTVDGTINTGENTVNKVQGTAPSIQGDSQDPLCTQCCRDHHDSEGPSTINPATALFDPSRPTSDYQTSGNHKHYYFSDPSNPQNGLSVIAETAGNRYLDACRFLRVDGYYRLMQDWRLVDNVTMPKDQYLTDGSDALSAYQNFVSDVVIGQAQIDAGETSNWSKSDLETRDISNAPSGLIQLMNRGIYVDRVYQADAPRTLDTTNYYTNLLSDIDNGANVLARIPFNEVNLTLLTSWSSSNTSVATVTSEDIKDISATTGEYYGTYSRGRASVLTGSGGSTTVTAHALPSNSGLTGGATRATYSGVQDYDGALAASTSIGYRSEIGVDRDDHRTGNRKSDGLTISRASSTGNIAIEGVIKLGNISGSLSSVTVTATNSTCTVAAPVGNQITYSCPVSSGYSGTVTIGTTQAGGFVRGNNTGTLNTQTCDLSNITETTGCPDFWVFGNTIKIQGVCGYTGNGGNSCGNVNSAKYTLTATASTGSPTVSCTPGSALECVVTLDATSKLWSGTLTLTATGNNNLINTAIAAGSAIPTTCNSTSVKTLTLTNQGPIDMTQAFAICAK